MDKAEKKKLAQHYKEMQRQAFEDSLPMGRELFLELFEYIDEQLETTRCDDDFTLTEQFLRDKDVDVEKVLKFLRENGGYCDCEVLFNVEDEFGE